MAWRWNASLNRYQDDQSGRIMARDEVLGFLSNLLESSTSINDSLAGLVANGQLSPLDWRNAMREELKLSYIQDYLLGRGGLEMMTQADWGSVGGMLADQYRYLEDFVDDIAAGNLTEAQIRSRAAMYFNSSREAYERAFRIGAIAAGADEVFWEINPDAENCPDCERFTAMGWQPIEANPYEGAYPGSGDTLCLTNCACALSYRNSVTGEEF